MADWLRHEKEQWGPSIEVFRTYAGLVLKTALIGMFLCHAQFLINGYTSPDGTNEGLFFYWNQRWALSRGLWMIEYLSETLGNVVMPPLYLAFNGLCAAAVMLLWADLWNVRSRATMVLGTVSLVVALSVTWQNLYIYNAYVYGFSTLMMVLAVYLVFTKKGKLPFVLAVVCLAMGVASYQAYIGFATGTVLLTLMLYCLQQRPLQELLQKTGKALAMGILGGGLYFAVLMEEIERYQVPLSDYGGLNSFGGKMFLENLLPGIHMAYHDFKEYFTLGPNHVGKAHLLILLGAVVLLGIGFFRLVQQRKMQCLLMMACGVLLPLGINIVDVFAKKEQYTLMTYPMQIMVPYVLVLAEQVAGPCWWKKLVRFCACAAAFLVCWLSVIVAYATYHTVGLAYKYVNTLTNSILTSVLADENYTADTRVLIAGLPDESQSQKFNFLRDLNCYNKEFVFWSSASSGVLGNWKHYIYDYHGLWIGEVAEDEYFEIIDSEEFADMPLYPADGSLQMFDDILVVKLEEDPPR